MSVGAGKCWLVPTMAVLIVVVMSMAAVQVEAQAQAQNNVNEDELRLELRSGVANVTDRIALEMQRRAGFCFLDEKLDWNRAFNYSNLDFLTTCMAKTEDAASRLCTEAEIRVYLSSFFDGGGLQANKNCNLTSWVAGCEPGWACSTGSVQKLDLETIDKEIPARTSECKSCCEGFFCPQGLTCMMPCPLGSYCPLATFNQTTGLCEPYNYQLTAGRNHTCGGANIWADVGRSREVFCPAGSYCPTTTEKRPCDNGHYCLTGSTSETRCSKLISCKENSKEQNIHTYGIMLIIALVALLLIIYNFSDQILSIRERRRARNREGAARSVQQKELVRARWKVAKDAATKHAGKLQANLSRRFSNRNHPENFEILHDLDVQEDSFPLPTNNAGNSSALQLSTGLEGPINRSGLHIPEGGPHNPARLGLEIKGKNSKEKILKEKEIRTDSQIFKYAYAQIEKEKSQERQYENITFSGVVSLATGDEQKKRPLIEVGFKDLTLTLKGKQRCLLKCLTGKIMPGRITAVMGPSGAGKTTLMSALAGKETGCKKSGLVLINGKPESIHSYKKIVGFVPQDDIVHGNLTVEENLRFSAWCRLSTKLPRAEKVLIVERVLMSLGLQEVRDSLVGTVEKRGISGGQRKRVNVGLEMVIEPSLLFLDEPTSGLDSSSSRLLLKALKHEALAGVNICMVVHQPSYALFKMFDDLILLAKGGHMVYHGSVRNVEEYFGGLGINVPERVNPPDHYIDILEGMVEPSPSSSINYKDLPLRWLLHNGYTVPEDMQSRAAELGNPLRSGSESSGSGSELQSFTTEIWQDVRSNVEQRRDHIHHYFLKQKDLADRRTPGIVRQYKYFLGRITKQRLREARLQATDYIILLLAGACLGAITKISDTDFGATGYTYTIIAISLLCQIAALRTFSQDKLQYLRESASGISSLAHFLAKDTVDHFNTLIKPVVFLSMFYFFTNPRSTFIDNYTVLICLVYCVTGMGYAFAIFLNPGPAQLFSVLFPVCLTLIASQSLKNEALKGIAYLCYPKWTLEALVIANARRYYGVWLINRCGILVKLGYNLHAWQECILILIAFGFVSRVIAFISLLIIRKK
ncbi:ABC transporter G family member 24-like [Chenopodium quinoa]|uniref:ABC transporter G family member 24-like n=1 Tax=Chenopodium quinoa TaxID=63459 RepID=UPI000B7996A4|nr:ABC transporter G family member 24-like [Chenopodium quinoa]